MSTSTADLSTGALSTEKNTYRRYVKFATDKDGKTIIDDERILAEAAAKDKKTGVAQNWQKAEDDGFTLFSENSVLRYTAKSLEGFQTLVSDPEQQLYIINAGLSTVQTAKANAYMKSNAENTAEPTPEFNQSDLDLRVGVGDEGEYSLQTAPQRRSIPVDEKIKKLLIASGKSEEEVEAILLSIAASMSAAK